MDKPDKLPILDPNVRGIYARLIVAAVEIRKQRKSDEYRHAELRRAAAAKLMREAREIEVQKEEAERTAAERLAEAKKMPLFMAFEPSGEPLTLRDSETLKFVR